MSIETRATRHEAAILVSDFDGTLTRHDFYKILIENAVSRDTPDYWRKYLDGAMTHFEAIRSTFAAAPIGEPELIALSRRMDLQPGLATLVDRLERHGWRVMVGSAGCLWYIDRLLHDAGVSIEVHANPGRVEEGRLMMSLPVDSPYFSPETGIDKSAVVQAALATGRPVAFAGDGPPDLAPALLVEPSLRFARVGSVLEQSLTRDGHKFTPFSAWSEIAEILIAARERLSP